jgi:glycosyltransferase involved in cell wall biosynthesis
MKKTKIIIASILKPIDDTRMFEKLGLSLAKTNKYEVNIIGFISKNTLDNDSITFYSHGPFQRTSILRFLSCWKVFKSYIKVKPDVIICNTHELLIVTFLYRILFGAKIIYDIRENYVKNIKNTNVFSPALKPFLAAYVRSKELLTKPFFHGFMLAERIYAQQLRFVPKSKSVVIENKYFGKELIEKRKTEKIKKDITLLYSGTISDSNGVFDAIRITEQLHELDSSIKLKIIGYCALKRDLLRLKESVEGKDFIELIGGDYLVPHDQIVEEIKNADFGFVLKKLNQGINDDKLLTRLFEYTANHLPILLLENPTWIQFCEEFNAAVTLNPEKIDAETLLQMMKTSNFYTKGDTKNSLWISEETKFLDFISTFNS